MDRRFCGGNAAPVRVSGSWYSGRGTLSRTRYVPIALKCMMCEGEHAPPRTPQAASHYARSPHVFSIVTHFQRALFE
jgi:hypothetical protein